MQRFRWLLFPRVILFLLTLSFATGCQDRPPAVGEAPPSQPPTATVKDLMDALIDPSADVVWESVTTVVTAAGTMEKRPQNDQEWALARRGAIRLVEGANSLMIPGRHVARPGEKSEAPGIELEPEEMEARIKKDFPGWLKRAQGFHEASLVMLKAMDDKNPEAVLSASDHLEMACETCHVQYWYPNQVLPPGYEETAPRLRK